MRQLLVIGIGAGDPDHLTLQAIKAMRRVDVFLVLDKGEQKAELVALREQMLSEHVPDGGYRVVHLPDPPRDRRPPTGEAYVATVEDWHDRRAALLGEALRDEVPDGGTAGLLVWGDPSLYDSTLRVVERIAASVELAVEVVPGVTALQALTAAHRVPLNRLGAPVLVTTGRRLADGLPAGVDDAVVVLDQGTAFADLPDAAELEVWWGAYLGTPDEVLRSGPVPEVAGEIGELRQRLRAEKGWIMDTYLLRRKESGS
ncbi:precorrin-6A synthase (deacetylating) [Angustibacter aerolatus]